MVLVLLVTCLPGQKRNVVSESRGIASSTAARGRGACERCYVAHLRVGVMCGRVRYDDSLGQTPRMNYYPYIML